MSSIDDSDVADTPLRVVLGPTAAGKSAIAMALGEHRGAAVVSADSRQVYVGFDIGTAKPTAEDRARVPHYGVDVIAPTERYSAHAWASDAERWLRTAQASGRPPVIVGGTGFYVRALVAPLDPMPALEPVRRTALSQWLASLDAETLRRWCARLDPARSGLGRTQQLRAVETALLAGVRISDAMRARHDGPATTSALAVRAVRYLVVDPGAVLGQRIGSRVEAMIAAGWLDEVRMLIAQVPPDAPAWQASGYGAMRDCVTGAITRAQATQRVIVETRQYAKRQRTWCRHQLVEGPVTRLDPSGPDALHRALAWWDGNDLGDA